MKKIINTYKSYDLKDKIMIWVSLILVVYSLYWIFAEHAKNPILLIIVDILLVWGVIRDAKIKDRPTL
ncbi:hypothetical protein [Xylocopilactobacillus apis]|uniref:Uncharacterized protein n=1 Tax=Xylocopilactobacillus apis TaxID=2932183 RepID=A0AAU9CRX9_9LACO|nr:hypothetical protein [Xylocopilactobacillus apis]BDR56699.1 hypothetical protein KIMC2_12610 [Xylocopilactobacillus apis]